MRSAAAARRPPRFVALRVSTAERRVRFGRAVGSTPARGFGGTPADDDPMTDHTTDDGESPDDRSDDLEECCEGSTPRPLTNLTSFKRDQLFVIQLLANRNPHGLVIKSALDRFYEDEINQARLYKNLRELVEEGYVEKRPLDGRTNAYRPSSHACERLKEHHEWERRCLHREHA